MPDDAIFGSPVFGSATFGQLDGQLPLYADGCGGTFGSVTFGSAYFGQLIDCGEEEPPIPPVVVPPETKPRSPHGGIAGIIDRPYEIDNATKRMQRRQVMTFIETFFNTTL